MQKDNPNYYAWVVAYIDATMIKHVERELSKYQDYAEIEAFIPTIKILKKTFKKENIFEEVPLLFNYGFFKIPRKFAIHKDWLDNLRKNISCIYAWVPDPQKVMEEHPRIRIDGSAIDYDSDSRIPVGTASSKEISELLRTSVNVGAHNAEDIALIKVGDTIVLRGYPFEGIEAELLAIDHKKKEVKVRINVGLFKMANETSVSFDNVFFTIYHNQRYYPDELSKNSLDAMEINNSLDSLLHKKYKKDANSDE